MFFYPGIVAGGDVIAPQVLRVGEKFLELDFAVTQNIRVRCSARLIFAQEYGEHPLPIFVRKINRLEGDIKGFNYLLCHCEIFPSGAVLGIVVLFPVFHEEACYGPTLCFESCSSNRRVNPPGESHNDIHFRWRHEGRPLSAKRSLVLNAEGQDLQISEIEPVGTRGDIRQHAVILKPTVDHEAFTGLDLLNLARPVSIKTCFAVGTIHHSVSTHMALLLKEVHVFRDVEGLIDTVELTRKVGVFLKIEPLVPMGGGVAPNDNLQPANRLAQSLSFLGGGGRCRVKPADNAAPFFSREHDLLQGLATEIVANIDYLNTCLCNLGKAQNSRKSGGYQWLKKQIHTLLERAVRHEDERLNYKTKYLSGHDVRRPIRVSCVHSPTDFSSWPEKSGAIISRNWRAGGDRYLRFRMTTP